MNYLLDTCVLSEFTRRQPDPRVMHWLEGIPEDTIYLSAITIGEIQQGIARLPGTQRKTDLSTWLNEGLLRRFDNRILSLDASTLILWGSHTAQMENTGHPLGVMDSLIIATALQHNLIIATRNVSDFAPSGVQMVNPWESQVG